MAKQYTCRDVGVDCDWRVQGNTVEEVLQKIAEHAKSVHSMEEIPPELMVKVRAAIREA